METSNDKRLVFGAMALFFFVFLESTLFFQTSLGMIVDSAAGSLLQFPIQGASALGLLLFSALNRITAPRIRSTAVGFLTLLGIASLACVAGGTSQALLVGAGCVAFSLSALPAVPYIGQRAITYEQVRTSQRTLERATLWALLPKSRSSALPPIALGKHCCFRQAS